jgi:hypothetical protein
MGNIKKYLVLIIAIQIICVFQVSSKFSPFEKKAQSIFYFLGGNEFDNCIYIFKRNKSNIEFSIYLDKWYQGKPTNEIILDLKGIKKNNPIKKAKTDECSNTEYPVVCYVVENDTCSFELYISIWNDRAYLVDKKNYFQSKYPQYNINFNKTFRNITEHFD